MTFSYRPVLWTRQQVESIVTGTTISKGEGTWHASGLCRRPEIIEPGDLWVSAQDQSSEKISQTANEMLLKGAVAAIVSQPIVAPEWAHVIQVENCQTALATLADFARNRTTATIIGVTGSVGKTTVKDILTRFLSKQAPTYGTYHNANCGWGLVESIAQIPKTSTFAVLELEMLNRQSIVSKSKRAQPHVALITAIQAAHLSYHNSLESIAKTKSDIIAGMQPGGTLLLPRDSEYFELMFEKARKHPCVERIIGFGLHSKSDVRLVDAELLPTSSKVTIDVLGNLIDYEIGAPGKHWVVNSLAVMATLFALNTDMECSRIAWRSIRPSYRRGERFRCEFDNKVIELIDDTWNASPASNLAAFDVISRLPPAKGGRRIVFLGDMLQLGKDSIKAHMDLAKPVLASGIDTVNTVGEQMKALHNLLPATVRGRHLESAAQVVTQLHELVGNGDVVLVKGSNGMEMNRIVNELVPNRHSASPAPASWWIGKESFVE